jgi:PHD/YefM family antitoxin component YafN of YafNO toxin-antitoxin module
MRAISLSTEPLAVSYALRQLVETGELAVFSAGGKAAVLIPLEKYQALVDVLRWLEAPARPEEESKPRGPKPAAKRTRAKKKVLPEKPAESTAVDDLLSLLD